MHDGVVILQQSAEDLLVFGHVDGGGGHLAAVLHACDDLPGGDLQAVEARLAVAQDREGDQRDGPLLTETLGEVAGAVRCNGNSHEDSFRFI